MYELPIFPLNTVLFPGMPLRLHIFEERYKVMLQRVLKTNQTFGVCLIKSGAEALGPAAEPYLIGCTARIVDVDLLEDGRANLTAVGDERFRIIKTGLADPYLKAFVESAPLQSHHTLDLARGARPLRAQLTSYLGLLAESIERSAAEEEDLQPGDLPAGEPDPESQDPGQGGPLDFDLTSIELPDDPMMLLYLSAALLQLPPVEKQPLLEADTAASMFHMVLRLLRRELAVLPPLMDVTEEQARQAAWAN